MSLVEKMARKQHMYPYYLFSPLLFAQLAGRMRTSVLQIISRAGILCTVGSEWLLSKVVSHLASRQMSMK